MTRIAILGCGRIARLYHLDILADSPGVEVAYVAEPVEALRQAAADRVPGSVATADYHDALQDGAVEAVVICLPTGLHAEAARAAFAAGKDVYLEKPLATTRSDALGVLGAWRASGRIGMLGFTHRFHPVVRLARERIRSGGLGRVIGLRIASASPGSDLPTWKRSRAEGGGALLDLGSHHADLARFLLDDEVRDVSAVTRSFESDDDAAWMTLSMASGFTVESRASLRGPRENGFEVLGEAGRVVVDRIAGRLTELPVEPLWGRGPRLVREVAGFPRRLGAALTPLGDPSYRNALGAFIEAVRSRKPIAPDPEDGERSLAIVLAAEEAAREGRRVLVRPRES